jgi:hypothetical protein
MAQYPPPIENLPIFDASQFVQDTVGITRTEADALYVHFPTAQGTCHFPSDVLVSGDVTCNQLNYTSLNPPIAGGTPTLEQVLTTGDDAGGLDITNLGSITTKSLTVVKADDPSRVSIFTVNSDLALQITSDVEIQRGLTVTENVIINGNAKLGVASSPDPLIQIQGSNGLGQVYDTKYNIPYPIGIGNITGNFNPSFPILPTSVASIFTVDTSSINTIDPNDQTFCADLIITDLALTGQISCQPIDIGKTATVRFWLGYAPDQVYNPQQMTSYSFTFPAQQITPYNANISFPYSNIVLSLNSTVAFNNIRLLATLDTNPSASSMSYNVSIMAIKAVVRIYGSRGNTNLILTPT